MRIFFHIHSENTYSLITDFDIFNQIKAIRTVNVEGLCCCDL